MGLGFGAGEPLGMGGDGRLRAYYPVLVGLDRIYRVIRASSAEIKALQAGFESLAKQLEPAGGASSIGALIIAASPRMASVRAARTGKCPGCGNQAPFARLCSIGGFKLDWS